MLDIHLSHLLNWSLVMHLNWLWVLNVDRFVLVSLHLEEPLVLLVELLLLFEILSVLLF